ncbi:hypothetical protein L486_01765 [Kwoniella mangroviensis CBS 10435]|uniref:DUF7727 domain-containing protein n=1 Tax=Kwoniella mangroviensis CBS 10435 TaxID=1331196 RepID=A0A1B9J2X3_9TREE|nr:hypothetical protein L486_01765 [Kwoniella mangroviensis CBS 10435]
MGKLIWHQWGRLLAITSAVYMVWASFWAYLYRKFFWDMIGGTLGPAGLIPGKNTKPLVNLVVVIPLLQTFTLVLALLALALEMPLPLVLNTSIHRSIMLRIVLYFLAGFTGIMVYQTVDCAIYFIITSGVYAVALSKGEKITAIGEGRIVVV